MKKQMIYLVLILTTLCILTLCLGCGIQTVQGERGRDGTNGINGTNGNNGTNGIDGTDGVDGVDGRDSIVEVIDPCGKQGQWDEVLFRMSSGQIFCYFENGSSRYLTILKPGSYITSDGTNCYFTIMPDGTIND